MTTRKRRSASERIEDLKAQLEALKGKAAEETHAETAPMLFLKGKKDALETDTAEAKRGIKNTNPATNYDKRILAHELWITEIEAMKELGTLQLEFYEDSKKAIRDLQAQASDLLNEDNADEQEVLAEIEASYDEMIESQAETFGALEEARNAVTTAKEQREAFKNAKRNAS